MHIEKVVVFNRTVQMNLAKMLDSPVAYLSPAASDTSAVPAGLPVELWVDSRSKEINAQTLGLADSMAREGRVVYLVNPPAPFTLWGKALKTLPADEIQAARNSRQRVWLDDTGCRRMEPSPPAMSGQADGEGAGDRDNDTKPADANQDAAGSEAQTVTGHLVPGDNDAADCAFVQRIPDALDILRVQFYDGSTVVDTLDCGLAEFTPVTLENCNDATATQFRLNQAPELWVRCSPDDHELYALAQELQYRSSVYILLLSESGSVQDCVSVTELGVAEMPEDAADANTDGYLSDDPDRAMQYFQRKYFVTLDGGQAIVGTLIRNPAGFEEFKHESARALRVFYSNWEIKGKPVFDTWLTSKARRTYRGLTFAPGGPRVIDGFLNLFTGYRCEPVKGDCSLYWAHVREVICSGVEAHYQYLRCWLGHMFQEPQELPEKAIVLVSGEGSGKGTLVEPLSDLLGRHYIALTHTRHITGTFNGHLRDKILIYANEALWASGDDAHGALKSLITDAPQMIEAKGVNATQQTNYGRFIFSSNSDRPVKISLDDRRFFVLRVSASRVGDHAYFQALHRQLDKGGRAALLYDLLQMDLTGFNPRIAPATREGLEMKMRFASSISNWWRARLKAGALADSHGRWPAAVAVEDLFYDYTQWCEAQGVHFEARNVFGHELAKMLAGTEFGPLRTGSGNNRTRGYVIPTLSAAREAFQRLVKQGPEIWAA